MSDPLYIVSESVSYTLDVQVALANDLALHRAWHAAAESPGPSRASAAGTSAKSFFFLATLRAVPVSVCVGAQCDQKTRMYPSSQFASYENYRAVSSFKSARMDGSLQLCAVQTGRSASER